MVFIKSLKDLIVFGAFFLLLYTKKQKNSPIYTISIFLFYFFFYFLFFIFFFREMYALKKSKKFVYFVLTDYQIVIKYKNNILHKTKNILNK